MDRYKTDYQRQMDKGEHTKGTRIEKTHERFALTVAFTHSTALTGATD